MTIFHTIMWKDKKEECFMCNTGVSGAAIVLVLFILLIIILGAYI